MRLTFAKAAGAIALMAANFASGQSQMIHQVDVPFAFSAGEKHMPAGKYAVLHGNQTQAWVTIRHEGQTATVRMPVLTFLANPGSSRDVRLVFDKIGDKNFLSEIWLPGTDGLLVRGTREKHTHQTVTGEQ